MAQAFARVEVRIKDGAGNKGATDVWISYPNTATVAEVAAGVTPALAALNGVTAGVITEANLHVGLDISGLTPNAGTGSKINETFTLSFPLSGVPGYFDFVVPARLESLISGGRPIMTDGGVIDTFADILEAPYDTLGAGDSNYTNRQRINLLTLDHCLPSYRKFGPRVRGNTKGIGV